MTVFRPVRLLLAALAAVAALFAMPHHATARTCLVLGGGGARGAAHIGVLKVLEREHVQIDCIAGTSMGAVVGGLYAAGYDATEIEGILRGINWKDMFRDDPARDELPMRRKEDDLRFLGGIELGLRDGSIAFPRGVLQGQKLQLLLRRLLLSAADLKHFDELPIPFRSVATDIGAGTKVVFADGDLAMAIRASMSIPGAFAPIRFRGRLMVDGGITDNVPVDVARELGATRLIVVDVGEPLVSDDKLNSPFSIANQMLTVMMKRETNGQLASLGENDALLVPELGDIASAEFNRTIEAVAAGEASAEKAVVTLRRFAVDEAAYAQFRKQHARRPFDPPLVAFLDVLRGRSRTAGYVEQRLSDLVGERFDPEKVEKDISLAYGDGSYERITYSLEERDGKTGLVVQPVDKGWGPNFIRFGMRLSDDFAGRNGYQLIGELNFTGLNELGGESRNRVQLGRVTGLHGEFYQPFGNAGQYYVAPYLDHRAFDYPIAAGDGIDFAQYRRSRTVGALELGYTPDATWRFSATLEYGRDAARLRVGPSSLPRYQSNDIGGSILRVTRDSLDSSGFPSHGSRFDVAHEYLLTKLGAESDTNIVRMSWDTAFSFGANRLLVGGRLASAGGDANVLAAFNPIGGLGNLSGYTENQVFATQTGLARLVYYRQLNDATRLFSVPVYLGGTLEAGGYWNDRDAFGHSVIGAGSVFLGLETFLGPVFLGYGGAGDGSTAFYLTFGSLVRSEQ